MHLHMHSQLRMAVSASAAAWSAVLALALVPMLVAAHGSARLPVPNVTGEQLQANLTMAASPDIIDGTGGWVSLDWTNHEHPKETDWIGIWCPASAKVSDTAPIKYMKITVAKTWDKGYGSLSMYLNNYRNGCRFALITGSSQYVLAVGYSNTFGFADYNTPMGIRTAIPTPTGPAGTVSLRVSWSTYNATSPTLLFGTSAGTLSSYPATTTTYTYHDMCDTPAKDLGWYNPGSLHTAVVSGLSPGATYMYRVEDAGGPSTSASLTYTTLAPPLPGSPQDLRIVAFGDMGNTNEDGSLQHSWDYEDHGEENSINTTRRIELELNNTASLSLSSSLAQAPLSLVLHIGDISYAVGYMSEWDNFLHQVQPVASAVPWMTAIGNHEMGGPTTFYNGSDSGGECGLAYSSRFLMPSPADSGTADKPWYGFIHGQVHIVVMSTEHDFRQGSEQHDFLVAELARVDRSITPWVIFSGHRPMYESSTNPAKDSGMSILRTALEDVLYQNKVDLVLWGHNHSYQRTCQVYNLECQGPKANTTASSNASASSGYYAPTHLVIGMAGYYLTEDLPSTAPDYIEVASNKDWGYMRLNINTTHMHVSFIEDRYGDTKDEFYLAVQQS